LLKANTIAVKHAREGRYVIEGSKGLTLVVTAASRRFLYRYARPGTGKPNEMSIGVWGDVTLAEAVERAAELRKLVKSGIDPIADKREQKLQARMKSVKGTTLRDILDAYRKAKGDARGVKVTIKMIERHAQPLLPVAVADIDTPAIAKALTKVQAATPKTARLVLAAIATGLDFAAVMELVPKDRKNPAQWRGSFQHLWPKPPAKVHYRALPYADAPTVFARLIERDTTPAYALAFLMLCGSRTQEVLGAPWSEVDLKTSLWNIPGKRMKMRQPHTVPLTRPALDILAVMRQRRPSSDYLFPAEHGGKMGNRVLESLIHRSLGLECSVHGMRSTLRDWLGDKTEVAREVCEHILAHTVGGVEGSYRRGNAIEKRKAALQLWANYLTGAASP
jgi:integrase